MRDAKFQGTTMALIHHVVQGDGSPPIVFVHGLGCAHDDWDAQVAHLSPRHQTVAVDLRGHGATTATADECTIERYGADIVALIECAGPAACSNGRPQHGMPRRHRGRVASARPRRRHRSGRRQPVCRRDGRHTQAGVRHTRWPDAAPWTLVPRHVHCEERRCGGRVRRRTRPAHAARNRREDAARSGAS